MSSLSGLLWCLSATVLQAPQTALPESLQHGVRQLASESPEVRRAALSDLLDTRDERLIPVLCMLLGEEGKAADRLRSGLVLGLVQAFPDQAVEVLDGLTRAVSLTQREAAAYGLGHVPGERALLRVLELLEYEPEERVRQAAGYAARTPVRAAAQHATAYALYQVESVPAEVLDVQPRIQAGLGNALARCHGVPGPDLAAAVLQLAGPDLVDLAFDAFVRSRGPEEQELAATLTRARQVNARWLGKARPAPGLSFEYRFHMTNVMADKSREIPLRAGASELELLRTQGQHLDRATRWEMPLDALFTCPGACAPRLETRADGSNVVHYLVPRAAHLQVGMGTMNIAYWQGRVSVARTAEVVLDAGGRPISETLRNEQGDVVARAAYGPFQALTSGGEVPSAVSIEMFAAEPQGHRLRFDLRFQVVNGVFWCLEDASVVRVTEGGTEELLALAHVSDLTVHPGVQD